MHKHPILPHKKRFIIPILSTITFLTILSFTTCTSPNTSPSPLSDPIGVWRDLLITHLHSSNITSTTLDNEYSPFNTLSNWKTCNLPNETYYLFLMHTKITINKDIELRSYLGECLPTHDATELELINLTYTVLWNNNTNLRNAIIYDVYAPFTHEKGNLYRALALVFILVGYIGFTIYVMNYPKKLNYKTNSEMERIQENIEYGLKETMINNNNNRDSKVSESSENEDDKGKNGFNLASTQNYHTAFHSNDINTYSNTKDNNHDSNNNAMQSKSEWIIKIEKQLLKEVYNSFDVKKNIRYLLYADYYMFPKQEYPHLIIIKTLKAIIYIWVTYYSNISIIFKSPIQNPEYLIKTATSFLGQFLFNGHYIYNLLFVIEGLFISLYYIKNKHKLSIKYICLEIIFYTLELYVPYIITYLFFWQASSFLYSGPISRYLFNEENKSCSQHMMSFLFMTVNFTFGKNEKFFPFCMYHLWSLCTEVQYYVIGLFLVWMYLHFKSLFIIIYILIAFNTLVLHVLTLGTNVNIAYLTTINRNVRTHYSDYSLRFITRAGPYLIGLLCGIIYIDKSFPFNKYVTFIKKYSLIMFICAFSVFWLLFFMEYIGIVYEQALPKFVLWCYSLLKHDLLGSMFLIMIICLIGGNDKRLQRIAKVLRCKAAIFIEKIAVAIYIGMPVITRFVFYKFNYKINLGFWRYTMYMVLITIITGVVSVVVSALFRVPIVKLGSVVKRYVMEDVEKDKRKVNNVNEMKEKKDESE